MLKYRTYVSFEVNLDFRLNVPTTSGAFFVHPRRRDAIAHRHVALVDDVMTSGATLREAAATLLRAGASRVDTWVLARTPPPRH